MGIARDRSLLACQADSAAQRSLADRYGLPFATDLELLQLLGPADAIPRALALTHGLVPLTPHGACLRIALANPADLEALDELQACWGCLPEVVVATAVGVREALVILYGVERA
jgi:hypothetical protein